MHKVLPLFILLFTGSCKSAVKKASVSVSEEKMQMMEADRNFSKMSKEKGMRKAFIEYMDADGVLLRPGQYPLIGASAIDFLSQINDTTFSLQWEPQKGYVAKSGEIGYTFGIFSLTPSANDTVIYGTYVSIWKKQTDGTWKYVLDSGNEGLPLTPADTTLQ